MEEQISSVRAQNIERIGAISNIIGSQGLIHEGQTHSEDIEELVKGVGGFKSAKKLENKLNQVSLNR